MGMRIPGISNGSTYIEEPLNPNPKRFVIMRNIQIGNNVVVLINYPDCTNYEGHKIIVFEDTTSEQVGMYDEIDPHFTETNKIIARFRPDKVGWDTAVKFAQFINKKVI